MPPPDPAAARPRAADGFNRPGKRHAMDVDTQVALAQAYGQLGRDLECDAGCCSVTARISRRVWTCLGRRHARRRHVGKTRRS